MKNAKIGRFGGKFCEYGLADSATFNDLLAAANETLKKGETLTVNGETVRGRDEFDEDDVVTIEPSTSGA